MPFSVSRVERVSGSFAVEEFAARHDFLDYRYRFRWVVDTELFLSSSSAQ